VTRDNTQFEDQDYWRSIVLYGLNTATYKMCLARVLLEAAHKGETSIEWASLADRFLDKYQSRLEADPLPQQGIRGRLTVLERAVRLPRDDAVGVVAAEGLNDVVPRFQTIGFDKTFVGQRFFEFRMGDRITLKDEMLMLVQGGIDDLTREVEARWSLLEGAFAIRHHNWALANDVRRTFLQTAVQRRNLTSNIPFLQGYQGNTCFYCAEPMADDDIHVDHVLPRQVLQHDEVWNLVLAHSLCNLRKSDRLIGKHYLHKLHCRNENIVGSSHPWRHRILAILGRDKHARWETLQNHHRAVEQVMGPVYWEGVDYVAERDAFYRRLITRLNSDN
jgi:hypothetical protein